MRDFRVLIAPIAAAGLAGCLNDDVRSDPDASGPDSPDASSPIGPNDPDALPPPADFEGIELALVPETPRPNFEFTLSIRALDEEGRVYRDYEGTVAVEDSADAVQGPTEDLEVTGGTLFVPLRYEGEFEDVTITVTDQDDPDISAEVGPFDVLFEGDRGDVRDVVVNEINWYGPLSIFLGPDDVWIELRNVSGETLNISQWTVENAGEEGENIALFSGTELAPDEHIVLGNLQNPPDSDEFPPTSLSGVDNVQIHSGAIPLELPDEGEKLVLRDVDDTLIDETPEPEGGWAAGDLETTRSMERVEDPSEGYGDGSDPTQWVTFNPSDTNTTHPGTIDEGTPSADNSDQSLATALPIETSYEASEAKFELTASAGEKINSPPEGTTARTGTRIVSTDRLVHNSFSSRPLRTVECFEVESDKVLTLTVHATASEENNNDPEALGLRHAVEWYTDSRCATPNDTARTSGDRVDFNEGEYTEIVNDIPVESGATHAKLLIEAVRNVSGEVEDAWAADDFSAELVDPSGSPN